MNIVPANETHIPGMLRLLQQVGQVHHDIRPDIFREGAQKYDETALKELLKDPARPIFIAQKDGQVLGYCFCIHKQYAGDPVLADRKELYFDDLCEFFEEKFGRDVSEELSTDFLEALIRKHNALLLPKGPRARSNFYNTLRDLT